MDLAHLKLFRDIARERSITRGAQLNGISQSAASQYLQELEKRLGVTLLDRARRPLQLTPAGRIYYEFCRDVLRRKEQLDVELERLRQQIDSTVRVAAIYSIGISELSTLEREFHQQHPQYDLVIEYLRPEKVYEAVLADEADVGLVSYPKSSREITAFHWRDEPMVLVTPVGHPLAQNPVVAVGQLQGIEFVGFDLDLPIARTLSRYFKQHDVQPELVLHFDNVVAIKEAVEHGSGVSILPEPAVREDVAQGRIAAVRLIPEVKRPVGILYRRHKRLNQATRAFLDLLFSRSSSQEHPSPHSSGTPGHLVSSSPSASPHTSQAGPR